MRVAHGLQPAAAIALRQRKATALVQSGPEAGRQDAFRGGRERPRRGQTGVPESGIPVMVAGIPRPRQTEHLAKPMRKIQTLALMLLALLPGCSTVPAPRSAGRQQFAPAGLCAMPGVPACPGVTPPVPAFAHLCAGHLTDLPAGAMTTWRQPGQPSELSAAVWPAGITGPAGSASAIWPGCRRQTWLRRAVSSSRTSPYAAPPMAAVRSMAWSPAITNPCCAAASCGPRVEQPVRGVPDDLLTIDLSAVFPELKDKRVRGRLERATRCCPLVAGRNCRVATSCRATLLYVDDAVELFFLQVQGPAGSAWPMAVRCV